MYIANLVQVALVMHILSSTWIKDVIFGIAGITCGFHILIKQGYGIKHEDINSEVDLVKSYT